MFKKGSGEAAASEEPRRTGDPLFFEMQWVKGTLRLRAMRSPVAG
jgi:hypothetical protein